VQGPLTIWSARQAPIAGPRTTSPARPDIRASRSRATGTPPDHHVKEIASTLNTCVASETHATIDRICDQLMQSLLNSSHLFRANPSPERMYLMVSLT
jgi:hypothetical protein